MAILSKTEVALHSFGLGSQDRGVVQDCLKDFRALSPEQQEKARPVTIETLFQLVLGGNASIQKSSGFKKLKIKPWSTNCHLDPAIILIPTTAEGVSKILTLCQLLGAKFSIRGGGHLQNPGFCSNDGGVVISMCNFKEILLSEDKSLVRLGAGLTWLEVYSALEKDGLTVTGGRVPAIGVPGLLLGGGLSFQNSEHGFSCMGVENYEIVMADGSIKNASKSLNSDLFWALKGGCANFGIVTRFDMTTVSNQVWAEARICASSSNEQILEAVMLYHAAIEKDNKSTLVMQVMEQATLLVFFYCAPVEKPAVFDCFYDIPFLMHVIPPACTTVAGLVEGVANVLAAEPQLHEMRTMSSLPDLEIYKEAEQARLQQIEFLKAAGVEAVLTMVFQPIPSSTMKAAEAKGGNPMGFLIMADWKNAHDTDVVRASCKAIVDKCEEISKRNGTYLPFRYANYASVDQNPLSTYGADNLQKLKDIALKYDPDGVFQKLQNGGWLVSRT